MRKVQTPDAGEDVHARKATVHWCIAAILVVLLAGCGSTTHTTDTSSIAVGNEMPESQPTAAEIAAKQTPAETRKQEAQQRAALAKQRIEAKIEIHKKSVEAKHKAKIVAYGEEQVRLLHQEEREGKIEKAIPPAQAEAEYNRRSTEGERKLKEMERRSRGELTPEEEKDKDAKGKEVDAEAEAIREGERLKEEGK